MANIETFIIRLQDAKATSPHKQGEFFRSEIHNAHIYQGKEFPIEELNTLYPKVLKDYLSYELYPPIPIVNPVKKPDMKKAREALAKKNAEAAEKEQAKIQQEIKEVAPAKPSVGNRFLKKSVTTPT